MNERKDKTRKEEFMHIDEEDCKFIRKDTQSAAYGVMGLALGKELKNGLDEYCSKRKIVKSKLIKALIRQYLDSKKNPFLKD